MAQTGAAWINRPVGRVREVGRFGYAGIVHEVTASIEISEACGKIVHLGEMLPQGRMEVKRMIAYWVVVDLGGDEEQGGSLGDSVWAEEIARKACAAAVVDEASAWKRGVLETSFAERGSA